MDVIDEPTLFTEITVAESATVSGGITYSFSDGNITIIFSNNPSNSSSNSPTPTPPRLLPLLGATSNNVVNI